MNTTFNATEAFCQMIYTCSHCEIVCKVWNSEDETVPYSTICIDCNKGHIYHDRFYMDTRCTKYPKGLVNKVFIKATKEDAMGIIRKVQEENCDRLMPHLYDEEFIRDFVQRVTGKMILVSAEEYEARVAKENQ